MNYRQYKTEDFLADEEFKQWVLAPDRKRDQFWRSWLGANQDKTRIINEAREIILSLKFRRIEPSGEQYENSLAAILKADKNNNNQKNMRSMNTSYYFTKIAASILIIIAVLAGIYLAINSKTTVEKSLVINTITKTNPAGQKSTFSLPDGTIVTLNAESSLSFPEQFNDSLRYVALNGEAFFEVAHNPVSQFVVTSGDLTTTVLGTSFNIRCFPEESIIKVSLATGKVAINHQDQPENEKIELEPGQQLVYEKASGDKRKTSFNNLQELGWKEGILIFDDVDLDEFIETLERWYGVTFEVAGNKNEEWHIEGTFDNESLQEILDGLSFTYNITYEINGKNVQLKL